MSLLETVLGGIREKLGLSALERRAAELEAKAQAQAASWQARVDELEEEKGRLEGLLDVADDPDARLTGTQRQSLYRQVLTGSSDIYERDFDDSKRRRILQLAHMTYALRGSAENLIETTLDFLLGDRIRPKAKQIPKGEASGDGTRELVDNTALQAMLDEVWDDPRNRLPDRHESLSRALVHEGELVLASDLSPVDGHLEVGFFDPLRVSGVVRDKRGRDAFLEVDGGSGREVLRYFVLDSLNDQIAIDPWPAEVKNEKGFRYLITETTASDAGVFVTGRAGAHGLTFFWPWNRPEGARRGRSELTSVIDMIDAEDEMIWGAVETGNIRRNFLLHVKDKSIRTASDGRDRLQKLGLKTPPRNPKAIATNAEVEIDIVAHKVGDSESWLAEELGVKIYGSKGMPLGWSGREPKLAGARESSLVPLRRLRRKQTKLLGHWQRFLEVSLELRKRAGITVPAGAFYLEALEVGGKDKQRGSEIVKSIATAVVQVGSVDGIKPELVNWLFVQLVRSELGLEVPTKLMGLPEMGVSAEDLVGQLKQLVTRKSRTDDGGEDGRDRAEERLGA